MGHEERLPQCESFQCDIKNTLDRHIQESGPVRLSVQKHDDQITNLEAARLSTMEDIKEIKEDVSGIKSGIAEFKADIKSDMKDLSSSVKVWVLSGIVGTVMAFAVPTMMLFYNAGRMSQTIEQHTKQIEAWQKKL